MEGPTTVTTTGPPTTTTPIETTSMCGQAAEMESLFKHKHKPYLPVHFNTDDAFTIFEGKRMRCDGFVFTAVPKQLLRASAFESRSDI